MPVGMPRFFVGSVSAVPLRRVFSLVLWWLLQVGCVFPTQALLTPINTGSGVYFGWTQSNKFYCASTSAIAAGQCAFGSQFPSYPPITQCFIPNPLDATKWECSTGNYDPATSYCAPTLESPQCYNQTIWYYDNYSGQPCNTGYIDATGTCSTLIPYTSNPGATTPYDQTVKPVATGLASPTELVCHGLGMCAANAHSTLVSLNLNDTPVGYAPSIGPPVYIRLTYNHRESGQPEVFNYFNVGPKWTLNVLSFIQDDPATPGQSVTRYVAGGGFVTYGGYSGGSFAPETQTQAILTRTPTTGTLKSYTLTFPDGTRQVFGKLDGSTSSPRRVFLTKLIDPQGKALTLNYTGLNLNSITDATNRSTTLTYSGNLVTGITDPFGRTAKLSYNAGRLASITDVLGITSSFTYDKADPGFINTLTTPYGTSTFAYGESQTVNSRWLELTDTLGQTERVETMPNAPGIATTPPVIPSGVIVSSGSLAQNNTFYWDKHAYPLAITKTGNVVTSADYTKSHITHWLTTSSGSTSSIPAAIKAANENYVFFNYPGQTQPYQEGTAATPSAIGRVLDDGTTQLAQATYNPLGKPQTIVDPVGRKMVLSYYPNNLDLKAISRQTDSSGTLATIASLGTYNSQHLPASYTDAAGQTWTYTYNANGQIATITNPMKEVVTYRYNAATSGNGRARLAAITNANGKTQLKLTYDSSERVRTLTDSDGYVLTFDYDNLDRTTKVTYPDGSTTIYDYTFQTAGNPPSLDLRAVTDRLGRTTSYAYDGTQRLTQVTDPLGRLVHMSYYGNGALHTLVDAKGNMTSFDIDIQGRVTAKNYADGTAETAAYENTTSRLKALSDALGQVKNFSYGLDDRLAGITYANAGNPTPSVSLAYDAFFPRVTAITDGNGTTQYQYQPVGTLGALSLAIEEGSGQNDTIAYQYDALGRVISRAVGDVPESFAYDAIGRLTEHTNAIGSFAFSYLGQTGQLLSQQIDSGAVGTQWSYDTNRNDRRLKAIVNSGGARGFQFTINPENIITKIREAAAVTPSWPLQTWNYGYDAADRVLSAQSSKGAQYAYTLDANDNISLLQGPGGAKSGSYNRLNQVTVFNGQAYVHDAAGNVIDDGQRTYQWDADGRLVGIGYKAQPAKRTTFRYDGLGRRTAIIETTATGATETRYLWCGSSLCQARTASDVVAKQYFAEGEIWPATGSRLHYAKDHLGSVRDVLAAPNGARAASYDYDPYGNPTQTAGGIAIDFRYAGMFYHQPSGLYLTQYRAYDPRAGRWLSRDPIGEEGGINLYAYVEGNPTSATDPLGLAADLDPNIPSTATTPARATHLDRNRFLGSVIGWFIEEGHGLLSTLPSIAKVPRDPSESIFKKTLSKTASYATKQCKEVEQAQNETRSNIGEGVTALIVDRQPSGGNYTANMLRRSGMQEATICQLFPRACNPSH